VDLEGFAGFGVYPFAVDICLALEKGRILELSRLSALLLVVSG
jgi:hypothetical protein